MFLLVILLILLIFTIFTLKNQNNTLEHFSLNNLPSPPIISFNGFTNNKKIGYVSITNQNGENIQSGNNRNGNEFLVKCRKNVPIIGYRYRINQTNDGNSFYDGLGPFFCKDGSVINDIYGNRGDYVKGNNSKKGALSNYEYLGEKHIPYNTEQIGLIRNSNINNCVSVCNNLSECNGFSLINNNCVLHKNINNILMKKSGVIYKKT